MRSGLLKSRSLELNSKDLDMSFFKTILLPKLIYIFNFFTAFFHLFPVLTFQLFVIFPFKVSYFFFHFKIIFPSAFFHLSNLQIFFYSTSRLRIMLTVCEATHFRKLFYIRKSSI